MSDSFKLFKKADSGAAADLTTSVVSKVLPHFAPVSKVKKLNDLLRVISKIQKGTSLTMDIKDEDVEGAIGDAIGLIPNPVARSLSTGLAIGRMLGDAGVDSAISTIMDLSFDSEEQLALEAIGDSVMRAVESKDRNHARALLGSATRAIQELEDQVDARTSGPKFEMLIAIADLQSKIQQVLSKLK